MHDIPSVHYFPFPTTGWSLLEIWAGIVCYLQVEALLPARREGLIGVELKKLRRVGVVVAETLEFLALVRGGGCHRFADVVDVDIDVVAAQ